MKNPAQSLRQFIQSEICWAAVWLRCHSLFILPCLIIVVSFAMPPTGRADCREGCANGGDNTNSNSFLGEEALASLTTGIGNTAIGYRTLYFNTTGEGNTAVGSDALQVGSNGSDNTAVGAVALGLCSGTENTAVGRNAMLATFGGSFNTASGVSALAYNQGNNNTATGYMTLSGPSFGGAAGSNNTAVGSFALGNNTSGSGNTAAGLNALYSNTTGSANTAGGIAALYLNTTGNDNAAYGNAALEQNTTGIDNTAIGSLTLVSNSTGNYNTATGYQALVSSTTGSYNVANGPSALYSNTIGSSNTAIGVSALRSNTSGSSNIAIGQSAGLNLTTGSNNIDIGNIAVAGEAKTIRIGTQGTQTATLIAGIRGTTVPGGIGVLIDTNGRLGTTTSSARYKDNIQPMAKSSEAILSLKPVTFRYKKELDPEAIPQFGLVAEEVAKVNPDLVAGDDEGKPYTVRYDAVNAMLLNEFLKEHRKVEGLEKAMAEQHKENAAMRAVLREQAAQIQKVSEQLAATRPLTRLVTNE